MAKTDIAAGFRLEEGTAVLARTPLALRGLLQGLPDQWLDVSEDDQQWTPVQVLAHLVEAEAALWIPRARLILEQGEAHPFEPFDRYTHLEVHRATSVDTLLSLFQSKRGESLAALECLPITEEALQQTGRHPEFGQVSLEQLLCTWVAHDLSHIAQIARAMARRYVKAVGPWKNNLRALRV